MATERQQRVYDLLRQMPEDGLAACKELFWTELNYGLAASPSSARSRFCAPLARYR